MTVQVAIVRVKFVDNKATGFSIPKMISGPCSVTAMEAAMTFIRKNMEVPPNSDIPNRIELVACEVTNMSAAVMGGFPKAEESGVRLVPTNFGQELHTRVSA